VPTVGPWYAGIISVLSAPLKHEMRASEVRALYEKFYEGQELVTLLGPTEGVVDVRDVEGTHGWTMGGLQVHSSGKRVVAVVSLALPYALAAFPFLGAECCDDLRLSRVRSTTCSRAPRPSASRTSTLRSATRSTLASPRRPTRPPSRARSSSEELSQKQTLLSPLPLNGSSVLAQVLSFYRANGGSSQLHVDALEPRQLVKACGKEDRQPLRCSRAA
jgi:hypothetical protein